MPAHNEAKNLMHLLGKMPSIINGKKVGVVVVDDGSTDETAEIAEKAGHIVLRTAI